MNSQVTIVVGNFVNKLTIYLLLAYGFRKMSFIGQYLKLVQLTFNDIQVTANELLIFF